MSSFLTTVLINLFILHVKSCSIAWPPQGTLYISNVRLLAADPTYDVLITIRSAGALPGTFDDEYCKKFNINTAALSSAENCNNYGAADLTPFTLPDTQTQIVDNVVGGGPGIVTLDVTRNAASFQIVLNGVNNAFTEWYEFALENINTVFVSIDDELRAIEFASAVSNAYTVYSVIKNGDFPWQNGFSFHTSVYEEFCIFQSPVGCCLCVNEQASKVSIDKTNTAYTMTLNKIDYDVSFDIANKKGYQWGLPNIGLGQTLTVYYFDSCDGDCNALNNNCNCKSKQFEPDLTKDEEDCGCKYELEEYLATCYCDEDNSPIPAPAFHPAVSPLTVGIEPFLVRTVAPAPIGQFDVFFRDNINKGTRVRKGMQELKNLGFSEPADSELFEFLKKATIDGDFSIDSFFDIFTELNALPQDSDLRDILNRALKNNQLTADSFFDIWVEYKDGKRPQLGGSIHVFKSKVIDKCSTNIGDIDDDGDGTTNLVPFLSWATTDCDTVLIKDCINGEVIVDEGGCFCGCRGRIDNDQNIDGFKKNLPADCTCIPEGWTLAIAEYDVCALAFIVCPDGMSPWADIKCGCGCKPNDGSLSGAKTIGIDMIGENNINNNEEFESTELLNQLRDIKYMIYATWIILFASFGLLCLFSLMQSNCNKHNTYKHVEQIQDF